MKWRRITSKILQFQAQEQDEAEEIPRLADWQRLLKKMAEKHSNLHLNILGHPDLIKKLQVREGKRVKIEVYRRWNILIRKAMQRIASFRAQRNLERWTRLIKRCEQAGQISFGGPLNTKQMKIRINQM